MLKRLDHDENQFIASGVLLARQGLIPYRDYPYFHMPYLVAIYAGLFRAIDHLLLAARLFSTMCAVFTFVILGMIARRMLASKPATVQIFVQISIFLILIGNPLFLATSGRAWNHDLPTLLMLVAFLLMTNGLNEDVNPTVLLAAGALMGVAVGTRLTFAPAALVMPLAFLFYENLSMHDRVWRAIAYSLGFIVALIPAGIIFIAAPRQFVFGNFLYPFFNTTYRTVENSAHATGIMGKALYVLDEALLPANAALLTLFVFSIFAASRRKHFQRRWFEIQLLILLIGCLLIGSLAPTPLYPEYFYTPMIFGIVLIIYALSVFDLTREWLIGFIAAAVISLPTAVIGFRNIKDIASWRDWVPMRVHAQGMRIAASAGHGRVLTLAPIFPLEGRAEIYPELATGPFAWRTAPFTSESMENACKELDRDDLEVALRDRPPTEMVWGFESELESPLLAYAKSHHVPAIELNDLSHTRSDN